MSEPAPTPPSRPLRRYLWIGAVLLLAAGAFYAFAWPSIEMKLAINALSSTDDATLTDMRARLRSSTDPKVDVALEQAVRDGDRPWQVRWSCVDLLLQRQRLTQVEAILRTGDLMTRAVVLKRLAREGYFKTQVVPDPSFRVEETVLAWLRDPKAEQRMEAVRLALALQLAGSQEAIRPLLDRAAAEGAGKSNASLTLIAASEAMVTFKDCGSVERVAALADADPDVQVRLRTLEHLEQLTVGVPTLGQAAVCPESLPPERVAGIVARALDASGSPEFVRALRIKALSMIQRHPAWLPANRARVWQVLDGEGNGAERRAALGALVDGKDPGVPAALARWLQDRDAEVREEAVAAAGRAEGVSAEALWIGVLGDESRSLQALLLAHENLKRSAGSWIGLPPEVLAQQGRDPAGFQQAVAGFATEQFRQGSSRGVTREAWAEAWFRWLAGREGLEGPALERALAARAAARRAMEAGDAAAARDAVAEQGLPAALFAYEEGWVSSRSPSRP